jgi:hypothetical protein
MARKTGGSGAGAYAYGRKEEPKTNYSTHQQPHIQQQQYSGGVQGQDPRYGNQQLPPQKPSYMSPDDLKAGYQQAVQGGYGDQYLGRYQEDIEAQGGFWKPDQQQQTYGMGATGVTGAKGQGGGWVGQGNPQFIAMMHSLPPGHPVRQQFEQSMGQQLQSQSGSFGGGAPSIADSGLASIQRSRDFLQQNPYATARDRQWHENAIRQTQQSLNEISGRSGGGQQASQPRQSQPFRQFGTGAVPFQELSLIHI